MILLKTWENLRELYVNLSKASISSNLAFVLNRKYDKYEQTLLLKANEERNLNVVRYLTDEFPDFLNLHETDKELQNSLHYSVSIAKDPQFITFLTKLDFDKNILRKQKDNKDKTPQDYDNSNHFELNFISIWDASKTNNLTIIEKLVSLKHYYVDDQTSLLKNIAAHIAAMNSLDKIMLFLCKNNASFDLKNSRGLNAKYYCEKNPLKPFRKKYKAILSGEVKEYNDLEALGRSNISLLMNQVNDKKLQRIVDDINSMAKEKNINYRKLFRIVDEDKNVLKNY